MKPRTTAEGAARLLHPVILGSVVVLLVNDHVLKAAAPGWLTGKLSDFAGLVFFPILLVAIVEEVARRAGRSWRAANRGVVVAVVATGVVFAAVKTVLPAAEVWGAALGAAQWSAGLSIGAIAGGIGSPGPSRVVLDPTDLIALPALVVSLVIAVPHRLPTARDGAGARVASGIALALAATATMATTASPALSDATWSDAARLTVTSPATVRLLRVIVPTSSTAIQSVDLRIGHGRAEATLATQGDWSRVRLSILAPLGEVLTPVMTDGISGPTGSEWDLTAACRNGCVRDYTVIVRWIHPTLDAQVDFPMLARLAVRPLTPGTEVRLLPKVDRIRSTDPETISTTVSASVASSTTDRSIALNVFLDVPAGLIPRRSGYPIVGTLAFIASDDVVLGQRGATITVSVGHQRAALTHAPWPESPPFDLEWLSQCEAGKECRIPIAIEASWDPGQVDPRVPSTTTVRWTIEARLESFDPAVKLGQGTLTLSKG